MKALLFLPAAFLALGIINLVGRFSNPNQKTNLLIETAQADVAEFDLDINIDGAGCFAAGTSGGGCCCGCCCGC